MRCLLTFGLLLSFACTTAAVDDLGAPLDGGTAPSPDLGASLDLGTDAGQDLGAAPDLGTPLGLEAGTHEFTLQTPDGRERRYLVHVPAQLQPQPPLVLNLHGGGGSAESTAQSTMMLPLAEAQGFLLAFPEGVPATDSGPGMLGPSATWNTGRCCGRAMEENIDDTAYINALLDDLATRIDFDAQRVYATGFSNGAMMSYRLACELSQRIAAVAPVGGQGDSFPCEPQRPVPVLHIHGTEDMCANYNGGPTCGGCFQRFLNAAFGTMLEVPTSTCASVDSFIETWRARNSCEDTAEVSYQQGAVTCQTWSCAQNTEITFCPVKGMGHTWPGGARPAFCDRPNSAVCAAWLNEVGAQNDDIGVEQIWAFFERHTLP